MKKKRVLILVGIVVIVMSGLNNIALSLSEDSQWNPYVLRWDQKLPVSKKKNPAKKTETAPIQKINRISL